MTAVATSTPYSLAAGDGLADVWWKTGRVTVQAGGAETGGSFAQVEVTTRAEPRPRGTSITTRTRPSTSSRARSPSW